MAMTPAQLQELIARYDGCPLTAAVRHPQHAAELMALNAQLEWRGPVDGSAAAAAVVHRALEDVLRARDARGQAA